MKIMVVADGRSPITRGWVKDLIQTGHDIILISSFPHDAIPGVHHEEVLPIAFSRYAGSQAGQEKHTHDTASMKQSFFRRYRALFQQLRYWLGPLSLMWYRPKFKRLVKQYQPHLIHALRIPYEGMLAVSAARDYPLAVSIWGNDLTLHATKNLLMRFLTKKVLHSCAGLITDVQRDLDLAVSWGFDRRNRPSMVALTSGGIDLAEMVRLTSTPLEIPLPENTPIIINPRGIRPGYVRNDTFFAAIPQFLAAWKQPVLFVCPSMAGQPEAEGWVKQYGIDAAVRLLPFISQASLWKLFQCSSIMVSITEHDGTPNSLLESMAMGAFPIVGDIESLREWITPGENGLMVNPNDPEALACAMLKALKDQNLRGSAAVINHHLVEERANRIKIRQMREEFYSQILNHPEV